MNLYISELIYLSINFLTFIHNIYLEWLGFETIQIVMYRMNKEQEDGLEE